MRGNDGRLYSSICCEKVYPNSRLKGPPNDPFPENFCDNAPSFRLNLLVADDDMLYFPYCNSRIARYRIHRSNGIQLEALPACEFQTPTVVNNVRIANFPPHRGGRLLVMTGGSEQNDERGTLSILPLPSSVDRLDRAFTIVLPVLSAWGLAIHDSTCRIAVSCNSLVVLILAVTITQAYVFAGRDGGAGAVTSPTGVENANTGDVQPGNVEAGQLDGVNLTDEVPGDPSEMSESDGTLGIQSHLHGGNVIRQFSVVRLGNILQGTHLNNIPCVAFNQSGNRLASASIDTTFAMYGLSEVYDAFNVNMESFVPGVFGQMLFQSSAPLPALRDGRREAQRTWAVHWVTQGTPPTVSDNQGSVWSAARHQHYEGAMLSLGFKSVDACSSLTLFAGAHKMPVDSSAEVVLYDDGDEFDETKNVRAIPAVPQRDRRDFNMQGETVHRIKNTEGQQPFALLPTTTDSTPRRKRPRSGINDENLLLVGLEETLKLYAVRERCQKPDDGSAREPEVCLLDTLNFKTLGIGGPQMHMFTNVIEIPLLNAFIVTSVGGGVFLVRVVNLPNSFGPLKPIGNNSSEFAADEPSLFLERVFFTNRNVIGTCVIEREPNCRPLRSYELWILQQDGTIECWDLSESDLPLDVSCTV